MQKPNEPRSYADYLQSLEARLDNYRRGQVRVLLGMAMTFSAGLILMLYLPLSVLQIAAALVTAAGLGFLIRRALHNRHDGMQLEAEVEALKYAHLHDEPLPPGVAGTKRKHNAAFSETESKDYFTVGDDGELIPLDEASEDSDEPPQRRVRRS